MNENIKNVPACATNTDENKANMQLNDTPTSAENQLLNGKILFDRIFKDIIIESDGENGTIDYFVDNDPAVKDMNDRFYRLFNCVKGSNEFRIELEQAVIGLQVATQQAAALYGMMFYSSLQEAGIKQNKFIRQKISEFKKGY